MHNEEARGDKMILVGSAALGKQRRRVVKVKDDVFYKSEWLEAGEDPELSPTMFLVEQAPNVSLQSHFHSQNQFQLFVQGSGQIGNHSITPITVHYAGAYTGYGPLIAGAEGVFYFTIRSVFETGAFYMPESRSNMARGPKRHLTSDAAAPIDTAALAALKHVAVQDLIPLQPDFIAAQLIRIPPGGTATGIDPKGSAGQFFVVTGGALVHKSGQLNRWEPIFASADEPRLSLRAGPGGAEVVLLQLPVKAAEYRR
jgi:hypothetical protein